MKQQCVILGSGLGGLSSGVLLARNGFNVTILEQASRVGGCLQCFVRNGVKYETGMHVVGSLDQGQILSNYLNLLGIKDSLKFSRLDTAAYDIVSLQGSRFSFANGREPFIESLARTFPSQRDALGKYCDLVESVASCSPFYSLNTPRNVLNPDLAMRSINSVIDDTIPDPLLRDVLVGNLSLYAAQRDTTPFSTHAFIRDLYNRSAFRIVGGGETVAKALLSELERYGGRVLTGQRAVKILSQNGLASAVCTHTGDNFPCDLLISDIHPSQLLQMLDDSAIRAPYRQRIQETANTPSVFSLFLHFKPHSVPYLNSNFYGFLSPSPWHMHPLAADKPWPQGYLYMHHCHEQSPRFAESAVVMAYMDMSQLSQWSATTVGHRGDAYDAWKKTAAQHLLQALEHDFHGISAHIQDYHCATPLTYRDYTLTPEGSIYGMAKDVRRGISGRISYKTKLSNLLLVGQNINAHGILGVLVGSLNACSHVLGDDKIRQLMLSSNSTTQQLNPSTPQQINPSTLIIGGGLGGLMAGALLAKEGHRVTVVEKNLTLGGGLQCFHRGDAVYATGMHISGGFHLHGTLRRICQYLGILPQIKLMHSDDQASDVVRFLSSNTEFRLPTGKDNFVDYLSQCFPSEALGIRKYVDALSSIAEEIDLYHLRHSTHSIFQHSQQFFIPVSQLIDSCVTHPLLRALLAYLNPLYAGLKDHTPAYIHALISLLHINGTSQFVGGSQQLADLLRGVILSAGGNILLGDPVTHVDVINRKVQRVETQNGNTIVADNYISAIHPSSLVQMVSPHAFTPCFQRRIESVPNTCSGFSVFLRFRPQSFPFFKYAQYLLRDERHVWNQHQYPPSQWPAGLMFVTPPEPNHATGQNTYADTMIINCLMSYDWVRPWESSRVGRRPDDYYHWKQQRVDQVLDMMTEVYPNFRDSIASVFAASPLTIRDYYGTPQGALYGMQKDSDNITLSQMSVFTKISNLFFTGQNINLHGLCGVTMTALETAESIVGKNTIVDKINDYCEQ